jgi:hypothetical protein
MLTWSNTKVCDYFVKVGHPTVKVNGMEFFGVTQTVIGHYIVSEELRFCY